VNGIEQAKILPVAIAEVTPIRQLIKAADVARRLVRFRQACVTAVEGS
jgi:hypothetical protein